LSVSLSIPWDVDTGWRARPTSGTGPSARRSTRLAQPSAGASLPDGDAAVGQHVAAAQSAEAELGGVARARLGQEGRTAPLPWLFALATFVSLGRPQGKGRIRCTSDLFMFGAP
jgi:hypothetical protein